MATCTELYIDTLGGLDLDGSTDKNDKNLPYFVVENLANLPTSAPSFMISPQSEIFCHSFRLSCCTITQFGQKSFDSIRQSEKLPDSDGEFGEGPGGVSLCCGSFCAILDNFQQVKNVSKVLNAAETIQ